MLTLNQIVSQITNLAAAHNQIAESGVGDFAEWQAKERSYPILWVFHESTSVNQMEITFSIRLICADRVIVGEEGDNTEGHEQEVLSDTLLVLLDFLAYFQQNHSQPYNVVTSATIDPFTERLNDRLAGNSVTIQIRQPFDWNKCQIPQTGAAIPPSVDGLTLYNFCDPAVLARLTDAQNACLNTAFNLPCADATFSIDGTQVDTVPSGADLDVSVELNGSPVTPTYNSGTKVIGVTGGVCASVSVAVSDATPDVGDTITITATPTGFTPTNYIFFAYDGTITLLAQQAGNTLNWTANVVGSFDIYVLATDGSSNAYGDTPLDVQGDADALAFILATGITDATIINAIELLVVNLKGYGIWSKMKAIYPMVGGTATTHKFNLKNPLDTNAAFRLAFNGGWVHSANGALPNGTNGFADTFLNPLSHLVSSNDFHLSHYSTTQNSAISGHDMGAQEGSQFTNLSQYFASVSVKLFMNGTFPGASASSNTPNTLGLTIGSTTSSTNRKIYFNGNLLNTNTNSHTLANPNFNVFIGANNTSGSAANYASRRCSFASIGDGLNDTESSNLYAAVQAFQTTLGRQV